MKKVKFREITTLSGAKVFLGKDENNNDDLMKKFRGKDNTIIHTVTPGSPFCVIKEIDPNKEDIYASGATCVSYSQDWRDNKKDTKVNVFTGKDISKGKSMKPGTWKVNKPKTINIKKEDIITENEKNRPNTIREK